MSGATVPGLRRDAIGPFRALVLLAVINSTITHAIARANVSTRTASALGRIKAFPALFAHWHSRHRSPVVDVRMTARVVVLIVLIHLDSERITETARVSLDETSSSDLRQSGAVQP